MLKNITKPEWKTNYWYELIYDDGCGDGFGFPCDENGNVLPMENPAANENLEWCRNHPAKFVRSGEVIRLQNRCREPVKGLCSCGQWVELADEYLSASGRTVVKSRTEIYAVRPHLNPFVSRKTNFNKKFYATSSSASGGRQG